MLENGCQVPSRAELEKFTKEELIDLIIKDEMHQSTSQRNLKAGNESKPPSLNERFTIEYSDSTSASAIKKKSKPSRPFDMSKYQCRPIALKVSYLGWNYMGLASQGENSCALPLTKSLKHGAAYSDLNSSNKTIVTTVEDYIFAALENCRLVADAKNLDLSRCGRTDKGVSGLSQVLVLSLRSALTKEQLEHNPLMVEGELAYIDMINKSLPEDIRVLSWAPVPASFNARFDCKSRSYKYFFTTDGTGLKLERMKEACEYLVGSHDFRNFCRQDGSKQITTFVRDIYEARIQPADISYPEASAPCGGCYELFVRGSGFIWHQIRCIMMVLFRIGQELEHPSLVKELLNVEELKQKPSYDLACPYPLVLFDCTYDISLKWQTASPSSLVPLTRVYRSIYTQWYESLTKAYHFSNVLKFLDRSQGEAGLTHLLDSDSSTIHLVMGGGNDTYVRRYIPIMKRPRTQPIEVINKRYLDRKIAKLESRKKAESDNHDNEKSAP